MAQYTKAEQIDIIKGRIDMLQGQLDNRTCLIGDPEKHFAHLRKEIAKANRLLDTLHLQS